MKPADESTPSSAPSSPRSTTFFRPSRPSRVMRTCCYSRGGTTRCCTHRSRLAGGNRRHLFMAAYHLGRQALVTDHWENTGNDRVQWWK
jgi:hypothetical protein